VKFALFTLLKVLGPCPPQDASCWAPWTWRVSEPGTSHLFHAAHQHHWPCCFTIMLIFSLFIIGCVPPPCWVTFEEQPVGSMRKARLVQRGNHFY